MSGAYWQERWSQTSNCHKFRVTIWNTNCYSSKSILSHKTFSVLLSQLSASRWLCQSTVLDRCYMHFVLWHTGGAGHDGIYEPQPNTTCPTASSPVILATAPCSSWIRGHCCRAAFEGDWGRRGWDSGGGGTQWKVNWSIDQAVEERGEGPRDGKACVFLLLLSSLTNLQVPVHYAIYVAMIYTF